MSSNLISYLRTPKDAYENGGDWLFGVHQGGNNSDKKTCYLIGFVHAEDDFYDPETGFPPGTHYVYNSINLGNNHNIIIECKDIFKYDYVIV